MGETYEQAMADEPRRLREKWAGGVYLQRGFYAHHLQAYFDKFPADQIRVCLFEDFSQRSDEQFADLFS